METAWNVLTRRKVFDGDALENSQLARVLNTFDLTALGVGSTLGVGVYVIVGHVARDVAGPSVVLSFLIAAVASIFAGLCYAEFGARTPRAGSAYIYSYTCIGEFVAFVIGWNLILEYVIGSASVAKGISVYIDSLTNDTIKNAFKNAVPINATYLADYFDFFSFAIAVVLAIGLAFGLKKSTIVNNLFTAINVFVVLFVIIAGAVKADANNWKLEGDDAGAGDGGFFPFGITGMIRGAATCFYAFIGFDCIATTGEEVRNPKRAIPIAIVVSLLICFVSYFSTATVVTMMVPFYDQDINAPLPYAFDFVGLEWAKWIVAIGGTFGLIASLFGAMFPLPRILYAMASDGLIFKFLGIVNNRFAAPVVGTLLAGILTGLLSALLDLSQLVNMMSIGTLLAYTIVAACVLLLRYSDSRKFALDVDDSNMDTKTLLDREKLSGSKIAKHMFGCGYQKRPTKFSEKLAAVYVTIYCLLSLILGLFFMYMGNDLIEGRIYAIVLVSVDGFLMILVLMLLSLQPTTTKKLSFKVPLVPFLPAVSILINIYLMLMLDAQTWIRLGVWMLIGVPMYIIVRFCCESKYISPETHSMPTQNGELKNAVNHIETSNSEVKSNGINGIASQPVKVEASAPFEEFSEDSGFGSSFALDAEANVVEEPPVEIRSKKSISSVDVALAELDNVILRVESSHETSAQQPDRKLSIDTVSNASYFPVEEKVVALVHREDIISEPTTPSNNPTLLVPFSPTQKPDVENNDAYKNVMQENIPIIQEEKEANDYEKMDDNEKDSNKQDVEDDVKKTEDATKLSDSGSDESQAVSLEDLNSERNESDTDPVDDKPPPIPPPLPSVIPPPPPLADFEVYKVLQIPRPSVERKRDVPTRPGLYIKSPPPETKTPEMPRRSPSPTNSSDEPADDHVVFGGKRYAALTARLEEMLRKDNQAQQKLTKPEQHELEIPKQSETLKPVMSQIIGEIVRQSGVNADGSDGEKVDYKPQSPADIRGKLEDIFRQPPDPIRRPTVGRPSRLPRVNSKVELEKDDNESNTKEDDVNNSDEDKHKEKMNDIFKTIKLRKVDSFNK